MAILDRVEPAYVPWTPTYGGNGIGVLDDAEEYVGRHRKPSHHASRGFSLHRLFHAARHRGRR